MSTVVTDLDGTLLDHGGRLGPEAFAAIVALRLRGVPVVPLTSKTEVELREVLFENDLGGIGSFENGAGLVVRGETEVLPAAVPVDELSGLLARLSDLVGLPLTPVNELPAAELVRLTGLPESSLPAMLARRFGLPFLAPPAAEAELPLAASALPGIRLTRGGIFWHLSGNHGKEDALERLLRRGDVSRPVAGLGDASNDIAFLSRCEVSVLIPGAGGQVNAQVAAALPACLRAAHPAGRGWAESIRSLLGAPTCQE